MSIIKSKVQLGSLTNYYSDAITSLMAMYQAQSIADSYESSVVDSLNSVSTQNGVYLTASDIPAEVGADLVRNSMNAHLTKVQSSQIQQQTLAQVNVLENEAKEIFLGRQITVNKIDTSVDCIDAVLSNKRTGQYRTSSYNKNIVKGKIKSLSLQNNLLVVEPNKFAKLLTPNREYFYVYMINIESLIANVSVS